MMSARLEARRQRLNGDEQGEERGTRMTEAECEAGEGRVGGGGAKTASCAHETDALDARVSPRSACRSDC
jgi:hypothetical protein